ncbi:glycosyltransferase family 2 protein [Pisolithus tinctorius Marx 270]|uniref:chitin synthase n=1 Tax=Pisolithus tinctorius Marx 270 TaxID=870435 RepID=A0A0C3PE39_PISTI|nr:glycosyltransferase family 2 protein [Pisolithus tinctorius Marx 270]
MVSIIRFKFIVSINFGAVHAPKDHDKFMICQVLCYTEGEASLWCMINSLAVLKYDDKCKLILIMCNRNIVGSGNDCLTPCIMLDILGADLNLDPELLSFVLISEGTQQHNMAKVYLGLYKCAGHVMPYLVVVKVGKLTERSCPRNRGKHDSQMAVMHFLNKVHYNMLMNPLELKMYHQIKNVICINPTFYEYLFVIDTDMTAEPYALNHLISVMIHDKKVHGMCGETSLANAKQSIVTMMQVYKYFISRHMAKAIESLFSSLTCLPSCFTLFCLCTPHTHKPLLVSNQITQDYSQNGVDTLHMRNLLLLREDHYLTTLLLKHFLMYKMQFIRDTHAKTVAPDIWKVLLSQCCHWINLTIHNLGELVPGSAFWFLLLLHAFHCHDGSHIDADSACHYRIYHLLDHVGCLRAQYHPLHLPCHDCCCVWLGSLGVHSALQVGHGWMDGFLYLGHPDFLIHASNLLILVYGQFLMGCHACCTGRIWQEDHHSHRQV